MHTIYIEPDIMSARNYKMKIIDFCISISDRISFEILLNHYKLTKEEYQKACNDFSEYYRMEDEKRRLAYNTNPNYKEKVINKFHTNKDVLDYFERMYQYDLVQLEDVKNELKQFMNSSNNNSLAYRQDKQINHNKKLYLPEDAYLTSRYTFESHCTIGGLYKVYDFKLIHTMVNYLKDAGNLFLYYSFFDSNMLEDPALYRGDILVLSVCTHERTTNLRLTEEQLIEFKKLDIPYNS